MSPAAPGRGADSPAATYRLQVRPGFGFEDVAAVADHLAALGVSHVYLSPILARRPGPSTGTTSSTTPG